jgi:hypothetical protein
MAPQYCLEYDHPVDGFSDWVLRLHTFLASTDAKAIALVDEFVDGTSIENRHGVLHARPRNLVLILSEDARRYLTIPLPVIVKYSVTNAAYFDAQQVSKLKRVRLGHEPDVCIEPVYPETDIPQEK